LSEIGFFGGLISVVVILIASFILSAFAAYFASYGEESSGGLTMAITFIVFSALGIWIMFL